MRHAVRTDEQINYCKIRSKLFKEAYRRGRHVQKWEYNIKVILREIGCAGGKSVMNCGQDKISGFYEHGDELLDSI
jgi:hypothetical protein